MSEMLLLGVEPSEPKSLNQCIVRLETSVWSDSTGLHCKKDITFLKRRCKGFNVLAEDISMIDALEVYQKIINLDTCVDGVYLVTTCNESMDWESGCVEEYDYSLMFLEP